MPRVHFVKKARKDNPVAKAGESYYWWAFRYGGKHFSKTYPKGSQLTQSAYLSSLLSISEGLAEHSGFDVESGTLAEAQSNIASEISALAEEIADELQQALDECQASLDNMPEGLQEGEVGQLLQARIDACEEAISELQSIDPDDFEVDTDIYTDPEDQREALTTIAGDKLDEIVNHVDTCVNAE